MVTEFQKKLTNQANEVENLIKDMDDNALDLKQAIEITIDDL